MRTLLVRRDIPSTANARQAGRNELAEALQATRNDTLAMFAAIQRVRPTLEVPRHAWLNPPLWELGHVGWFQEYWIARNPARGEGWRADPDVPRRAGVRAGSDALYNSSTVPHDTRWSLDLPDARHTQDDLARQLETTLGLLASSGDDDDALYFFRLALFHEDMHHEAALYMAQALGIAVDDPRRRPRALRAGPRQQLEVPAGARAIGHAGPGFAFDNELRQHVRELPAFAIDATAVAWSDFLPFVAEGGYDERSFWTDEGWQWLRGTGARAPRYLSSQGGRWHVERFGAVEPLDLQLPACHLSRHEAEAWCRWAGRRLPTEFEWEVAATTAPEAFEWGAVWEWTASPFSPYGGFERHPYRDYSAPWFDGRPVLRGGSFATNARMKHARYRNFFTADRTDVFAGFRSCAAR
jgi:ergothioneine biosynthesis protein EgtB